MLYSVFSLHFFLIPEGTMKKRKVTKCYPCCFYCLPGEKKMERCSSRIYGFGSIPLFLIFDHLFTSLWFERMHTELLPLHSNSKPTGQTRYKSLISYICRMNLVKLFQDAELPPPSLSEDPLLFKVVRSK